MLLKFFQAKFNFMSIKCVYPKTEIFSVLSLIEKEYKKIYNITTPRNGKLMKSYAQIAIIALGGWIEDGLEELTQLSIVKLREIGNQKKATKFIDQIYGFNYDYHFSKAMMLSFGAHGLEFIESKVGDSDIAILNSSLNKLKKWRDKVAHSHRTVIPCNLTQVIREFNIIFPILKQLEKYAKEYKKKHF